MTFHEPRFANPNEETGDRTTESFSTFGLRISFVIRHSTTCASLVHGPNAWHESRGGFPRKENPPILIQLCYTNRHENDSSSSAPAVFCLDRSDRAWCQLAFL